MVGSALSTWGAGPGRAGLRDGQMPIRVVLDACVLVPHLMCDVLLHLAEEDMYVPL